MSGVPVVRIGDTLVAAVGGDIDDDEALRLQQVIAESITAQRLGSVVVDVSGADFVDSFVSRVLSDIAATSRLLGARVAVVGMRPAVAITLVELGLELDGVVTALTIDDGRARLAALADEDEAEGRGTGRGRPRR